jgi:CBS domain-containing protein
VGTEIGSKILVNAVMQPGVLTVSAELPITSFLEFLTGEEISGAPVVDQHGVLKGIASKTDVVNFQAADPAFYNDEVLQGVTVEEIMTQGALTVNVNDPVSEAARKMVENNVHRIIVVDSGNIYGILTAFDLLKLAF